MFLLPAPRCEHRMVFDLKRFMYTGVMSDICSKCCKTLREIVIDGDERILDQVKKVDYFKKNAHRFIR